jgi:hypothetical protein
MMEKPAEAPDPCMAHRFWPARAGGLNNPPMGSRESVLKPYPRGRASKGDLSPACLGLPSVSSPLRNFHHQDTKTRRILLRNYSLEKGKAVVQRRLSVTPAEAGVQKFLKSLDSGFRRNDAEGSSVPRSHYQAGHAYLCQVSSSVLLYRDRADRLPEPRQSHMRHYCRCLSPPARSCPEMG